MRQQRKEQFGGADFPERFQIRTIPAQILYEAHASNCAPRHAFSPISEFEHREAFHMHTTRL